MSGHIDIVFDGPPGPDAGRFVEVEDQSGKSIRFGEWIKRDDGYWALRLAQSEAEPSPAMSGQTNEGAGSADFWKAQYEKLAAAVDGGYYGEYPCADCPHNAPPSTGDTAPEPGAVDCPPAVDKG